LKQAFTIYAKKNLATIIIATSQACRAIKSQHDSPAQSSEVACLDAEQQRHRQRLHDRRPPCLIVSAASAPMLSRQTIAHVLKESEAQKSFRETNTRLILHMEGIFHGNQVSIGV